VALGLVMMLLGVRPWKDIAYFYSLMAAMLAALVIFTVVSEFVRGGRVISRHTGLGLFGSMVHLWHRNTRRYGGAILPPFFSVVTPSAFGMPPIPPRTQHNSGGPP